MPAPSFSSNGPMTAADCEMLANHLLDPAVGEYPVGVSGDSLLHHPLNSSSTEAGDR